MRRFRRLCELIQVQVCSRRPPPASPRASRKFPSNEIRDSESGGSDNSDKLSLLTNDGERSQGSSVKSKGGAKKPSSMPATPSQLSQDEASNRPSPKSPVAAIPEESKEKESSGAQTNQDVAITVSKETSKSQILLDNNSDNSNSQNGVEKHENGNSPAAAEKENGESACDNVRTKVTKPKTRSCRGDSTDALLSDEEKSSSVDENASLKE